MPRGITAARGPELRCKGWRQETILRLLENNLENAANPEDLVIYGGNMKAARNWDAFDAIVRSLKELETDQTLVVQSGKPVGVFRTSDDAPLVIIVNGVATGSTEAETRELFDKELLMVDGMTAGAWQYIGSQGIIQGTYESFMQAARQGLGGSLRGRTILTTGAGGMGGAQPLAGKLAGASILVVDAEPSHLRRRIDEGYLDRMTDDIGAGVDDWLAAATEGRAASFGIAANITEVLRELAARGVVPDVVTDQTSTDPLAGYLPEGLDEAGAKELLASDPDELLRRSNATLAEHVRGLLDLQRKGAIVFEYGNNLRKQAVEVGVEDAFEIGGFIDMFIRPLFCQGIGPFRIIAIQGDPATIHAIDAMLLREFADVPRVVDWLGRAKEIAFTGLPARVCWLGHTERTRAALAINDMIARGEITGPVAFSRDHLDAGSVTARYRETENMLDGSDCVGDWPLLNAILNGVAGADLTSVIGWGLKGLNSGPTTIADGTPEAARRLRRVMDADTGLGVIRQADAGYPTAIETRERYTLGIPS
ncbi:urocanate hydratase [Streptomyces sp. NPDC047081]|uniref:urocanate hydratase n=1 Tax=Streptomyces sp. NPDC047081 TaxID=3154706 RepID=UPI00340438EF